MGSRPPTQCRRAAGTPGSPCASPTPAFPLPRPGYLGPAGGTAQVSGSLLSSPPAAAGANGRRWLGVALFSGVATRPRARWVGWTSSGGAPPKAITIPSALPRQELDVPRTFRAAPISPASFDNPQLPGPTLFLCWGRNCARTQNDLGPGLDSSSA